MPLPLRDISNTVSHASFRQKNTKKTVSLIRPDFRRQETNEQTPKRPKLSHLVKSGTFHKSCTKLIIPKNHSPHTELSIQLQQTMENLSDWFVAKEFSRVTSEGTGKPILSMQRINNYVSLVQFEKEWCLLCQFNNEPEFIEKGISISLGDRQGEYRWGEGTIGVYYIWSVVNSPVTGID